MLDETKKLYEKTRLTDVSIDDGPVPITYVHVFHKEYPRLPAVKLPETDGGELEKILSERGSSRNFSGEPLTLEETARILRTCRILDKAGGPDKPPERRTYPSAGARFPIEAYIVSFDVEGLEPGAYHYNIVNETLEQLWKKDLRDRHKEIVSPFVENPSAAVVMTSVMARSEVKYGYKAFQYSMIEAGHMGQNMQMACTKYGIGSCPIGGFVNGSIEKILDLTEDEIPIYVLALGKKKV